MNLRFYNTASRRREEFAPIEPGVVRLYTCGPTVYNHAHIGNFRAYVFEDILRRTLLVAGYKVKQVMNLTDVDDKTIKAANLAGVSLQEYTKPFVEAFFADLRRLKIQAAEYYPAATGHIPEMISLIQRLMEKKLAYRSDDGSVYFRVTGFPGYGKPAGLDISGLKAGVRVARDEYDKEGIGDFALWKAWEERDGAVGWDSPWGRGRPGWHVECSAMAMKYLGEQLDIHTGGIDNLFPHHVNETAQSEGVTGKTFVRYWLHCAHLRVNGEKMAKSLGNMYTLDDLLSQGYTGREIRYVLLGGHYRQPLNFTLPALTSARSALSRMDSFCERLAETANGVPADKRPPVWVGEPVETFRKSMANDLATPEALAAMFDLVHRGNRMLDNDMVAPGQAGAALAALAEMDKVTALLEDMGSISRPGEDVLALLKAREAARESRQWDLADSLRQQIAAQGWIVQDTPRGQKLRRMAQ